MWVQNIICYIIKSTMIHMSWHFSRISRGVQMSVFLPFLTSWEFLPGLSCSSNHYSIMWPLFYNNQNHKISLLNKSVNFYILPYTVPMFFQTFQFYHRIFPWVNINQIPETHAWFLDSVAFQNFHQWFTTGLKTRKSCLNL